MRVQSISSISVRKNSFNKQGQTSPIQKVSFGSLLDNFAEVIPRRLYRSTVPYEHLEQLAEQYGITHILDLRERFSLGDISAVQKLGIEHIHWPLEDQSYVTYDLAERM
ncbi:MAG: hypothetical protein PHC64_08355, partial [Candidatus Gastranaerophilales bacterium]|nr:hypothetical protein [Candidatus Gastranaerophilales bacterium]